MRDLASSPLLRIRAASLALACLRRLPHTTASTLSTRSITLHHSHYTLHPSRLDKMLFLPSQNRRGQLSVADLDSLSPIDDQLLLESLMVLRTLKVTMNRVL